MGLKHCSPFSEDEDHSKPNQYDQYGIDVNKPRALSLLDCWANERAGFYNQAWLSRIGYKEFFDTQKGTQGDTAEEITLNWTKCCAFVAGADGLSQEEKDILIKTQIIWSGYTLKVKELESAINDGVYMNVDEAAKVAKRCLANAGVGEYQSCIQLLHFAISIAGVDGLSNEEKERCVEIGKALHVKEDDINEVIETYLMEMKFHKRLNNLLGSADVDKI
eukprot:1009861_1